MCRKISKIFYIIGHIVNYLILFFSIIAIIDGIFAERIIDEGKTLLGTKVDDDSLLIAFGIIFLIIAIISIIIARYARKAIKKDFNNEYPHLALIAISFISINWYYFVGAIFAEISIYLDNKQKRKNSD